MSLMFGDRDETCLRYVRDAQASLPPGLVAAIETHQNPSSLMDLAGS
jgi:hypothetical protein